MTVTAIVGAQWGDEGKGRIIDYLAQEADMVIRFQGGDNAGHTVVNEHGTFRLHLVPSGIFNPRTRCIIGTGVVLNPARLLEEMAEVTGAGVSVDNLWISERAQVVMPYHMLLDGLEEGGARQRADRHDQARHRAGLCRQGGPPGHPRRRPAAAGLAARAPGPGAGPEKPHAGRLRPGRRCGLDDLLEQALGWGKALGPRIVDTLPVIQEAVRGGRNILLEGQLGVMRDLDWGTYPYVTSSNPIAGGASAGAGLPPSAIGEVIGVVKAYCTAVGAGPFPVELNDENGARLREVGQEYGATTGRPRRCGWFDGVAIGYATWLNGFTGLAITKLDVLDGFAELKICTGYRLRGRNSDARAGYARSTSRSRRSTRRWPGWQTSTENARRWEDLPAAAQAYLRRIEELAGAPLRYVSVGPGASR